MGGASWWRTGNPACPARPDRQDCLSSTCRPDGGVPIVVRAVTGDAVERAEDGHRRRAQHGRCRAQEHRPCEQEHRPCEREHRPCEQEHRPCERDDLPCEREHRPCERDDFPCAQEQRPCERGRRSCERRIGTAGVLAGCRAGVSRACGGEDAAGTAAGTAAVRYRWRTDSVLPRPGRRRAGVGEHVDAAEVELRVAARGGAGEVVGDRRSGEGGFGRHAVLERHDDGVMTHAHGLAVTTCGRSEATCGHSVTTCGHSATTIGLAASAHQLPEMQGLPLFGRFLPPGDHRWPRFGEKWSPEMVVWPISGTPRPRGDGVCTPGGKCHALPGRDEAPGHPTGSVFPSMSISWRGIPRPPRGSRIWAALPTTTMTTRSGSRYLPATRWTSSFVTAAILSR